MPAAPATVAGYLRALPEDRRAVVAGVREVIRRNLPDGYREALSWGMISYEVPLARYPDTYNGRPLAYAALAAQKGHFALYLMGAYQDPATMRRLEKGFAKAGKRLDMGKSCLRFQSLDDLPLGVIGEVVASTPPEAFIARYEASRRPASPRRRPAR